jgi:hypothetical protein
MMRLVTGGLRIASVALLLGGCSLISFDVSSEIPPQTVPGSPLGSLLPASLFAVPVNVNIQSETAARGTGPASSATLSSLTLTITSPAGATFEFLDTITIFVSASADPNLPEKEIGRLDPVPGTASISIPPTGGVNLLPYINAGASITAKASGHMPAQDVTFTGVVVIRVQA